MLDRGRCDGSGHPGSLEIDGAREHQHRSGALAAPADLPGPVADNRSNEQRARQPRRAEVRFAESPGSEDFGGVGRECREGRRGSRGDRGTIDAMSLGGFTDR